MDLIVYPAVFVLDLTCMEVRVGAGNIVICNIQLHYRAAFGAFSLLDDPLDLCSFGVSVVPELAFAYPQISGIPVHHMLVIVPGNVCIIAYNYLHVFGDCIVIQPYRQRSLVFRLLVDPYMQSIVAPFMLVLIGKIVYPDLLAGLHAIGHFAVVKAEVLITDEYLIAYICPIVCRAPKQVRHVIGPVDQVYLDRASCNDFAIKLCYEIIAYPAVVVAKLLYIETGVEIVVPLVGDIHLKHLAVRRTVSLYKLPGDRRAFRDIEVSDITISHPHIAVILVHIEEVVVPFHSRHAVADDNLHVSGNCIVIEAYSQRYVIYRIVVDPYMQTVFMPLMVIAIGEIAGPDLIAGSCSFRNLAIC